jgi:hypothetical protein
MPKMTRKKGGGMATSPLKRSKKQSATDAFVERFSQIIETGARGMGAKQLRESEKKFNDAIDRANPRKRSRAAMDTLLTSMDELAVAASKKMSTNELRKVRKEINDLVDRAVERKPRRETA